MTACCKCDDQKFPPEPDIPPGLAILPRQVLGFPEYRHAMLGQIRKHVPLVDLRARAGDDLGLMLLESWAYVLDVVGFYDQQIAQNLYLSTATDLAAMRRLTALIGYRPRPAVAADVLIAAIADQGPPVVVPLGTAFRSEAFGANPPQIFETDADLTIDWRKNRWTIAPIVPNVADGTSRLLFDVRTLRLVRDSWAIFGGAIANTAALVTDIKTVKAVDGGTYAEATVSPTVTIPAGTSLPGVTVRMPTATARLNAITSSPATTTTLTLDAVYPTLLKDQQVLVVSQGNRSVMTVASAVIVIAVPSTSSTVPGLAATQVTLTSALPSTPAADMVLHFQFVDAGRLARSALVRLQNTSLLPSAALAGVVEPLDSPAGGPLLVQDSDHTGVKLDATVNVTDDGVGTLVPSSSTPAFDPPLVPAVNVFGNVLHVVRGETVAQEVLGSGDAKQSFPTFQLKKKPLTYLSSPSALGGRKSSLAVRVNGILWREVSSFYGTNPDDPVYIVRQDDEQNSFVTFWRVPSGVSNIIARYRFGAGAAAPPADSIAQIVRRVKGLSRVLSPIAAGGGSDADQPKDIKRNAPTVALTLGRAVSLDDFAALARSYGVVNVAVGWAWDTSQQRAVVKVWYIADGGDIADALRAFLIGQADPTVALSAEPAQAAPRRLLIDVVTNPAYDASAVQAALVAALTDPDTGLLAHANVPIGGSLFRSVIFEAAMQVPGVSEINGMTVDGVAADFALTANEGEFLDFLPFTNT